MIISINNLNRAADLQLTITTITLKEQTVQNNLVYSTARRKVNFENTH